MSGKQRCAGTVGVEGHHAHRGLDIIIIVIASDVIVQEEGEAGLVQAARVGLGPEGADHRLARGDDGLGEGVAGDGGHALNGQGYGICAVVCDLDGAVTAFLVKGGIFVAHPEGARHIKVLRIVAGDFIVSGPNRLRLGKGPGLGPSAVEGLLDPDALRLVIFACAKIDGNVIDARRQIAQMDRAVLPGDGDVQQLGEGADGQVGGVPTQLVGVCDGGGHLPPGGGGQGLPRFDYRIAVDCHIHVAEPQIAGPGGKGRRSAGENHGPGQHAAYKRA